MRRKRLGNAWKIYWLIVNSLKFNTLIWHACPPTPTPNDGWNQINIRTKRQRSLRHASPRPIKAPLPPVHLRENADAAGSHRNCEYATLHDAVISIHYAQELQEEKDGLDKINHDLKQDLNRLC